MRGLTNICDNFIFTVITSATVVPSVLSRKFKLKTFFYYCWKLWTSESKNKKKVFPAWLRVSIWSLIIQMFWNGMQVMINFHFRLMTRPDSSNIIILNQIISALDNQ